MTRSIPPLPILVSAAAVVLGFALVMVGLIRRAIKRTYRRAFIAGVAAGGLAGYSFRPTRHYMGRG